MMSFILEELLCASIIHKSFLMYTQHGLLTRPQVKWC